MKLRCAHASMRDVIGIVSIWLVESGKKFFTTNDLESSFVSWIHSFCDPQMCKATQGF